MKVYVITKQGSRRIERDTWGDGGLMVFSNKRGARKNLNLGEVVRPAKLTMKGGVR